VSIAIRFGVPVFVRPLKEEPRGFVGELAADNGALAFRVTNDGNVHFVIQSIQAVGKDAKGAETFRKEAAGWYLLPGASRAHSVEIPAEACPGTARIELSLRTDRFPLSETIEITAAACRR
jgi:fimbrial chaperone protein